jgi:predicted CoA-substrate-specific enzyme activase
MIHLAGLDIGSAQSKAVILQDGGMLSFGIKPTEGNFSRAANGVLEYAIERANLGGSAIDSIGACGMGASFISHPSTKISEISCQSRGIHYLFPAARTLIEVGNQTSKVIKITKEGKVGDCLVGDRCAAGSSRVLQIVAKVLKVNLEDMGRISLKSTSPVKFTTGCAVFLETEAISRVAEGNAKKDIIAGLHQTLAARISAMAQRMKLEEDCVITGGGAKDIGLVKALERQLGIHIFVPDEPLLTAAIGAALIAAEKTVLPVNESTAFKEI